MNDITISIIINTHNRGWHLKRLLDALLRQTYDNFEVVVVNGPSTDNTSEIMQEYQSIIKIETCPIVNLCVSRNIGIKAASGEIVAFIDDDAVPADNYWIENASKAFNDEKVGVVAGEVKRINGDVEFVNGYFSIWGENICVDNIRHDYNDPHGEKFNRGQGCNIFFRKKALIDVGGFDEYYAYFLDETDVCLRIIKSGYRSVYCDNMIVYHEAAGSINRTSEFNMNWNVISKSQGYFVIKATEDYQYDKDIRKRKAEESCAIWLDSFKEALKVKKITKDEYKLYCDSVRSGIQEGIEEGFLLDRNLDFKIPYNYELFKQFKKSQLDKSLNLCLLCSDDVKEPIGGCAVYVRALADEFIKMGHNVHVISLGQRELMMNFNGINIHTVVPENIEIEELITCPSSNKIISFSYECFKKIQQLKQVFNIDIIETPVWDAQGVVPTYLERDIPIITRIETPLKKVIETFELDETFDFRLITLFETEMMKRSSAIIAISDSIKETVEDLYNIDFGSKVYKNYLGIKSLLDMPNTVLNETSIKILFVGRLERRKGVHIIMESIPHLMKKYSNLNFTFIGDDNVLDEKLGMSFKENFLKDNKREAWINSVSFLGKTSDEKKEKELMTCDIFISPSLYESFGIVFLEAMNYSKPVVGCNVGGMREVIKVDETGLLCKPNDTISFMESLEKLIEDDKLRRMLGQQGKIRLEAYFTQKKMTEGALKIYKDVISQNKSV